MFAILFVIIALSGYVGWHLWMLPPVLWLRWTLVGVEAACVAMAVLSLTRYLDRLPYGLSVAVYNVGNKGLIILLYLFMAFLLADLLRLVHVLPTAWLRDNWWTCGVLLVAMAALFIYGSLNYEHKRRVELTVDTQGKVDHPVKVLAVSDLHLGYHNRRADLDRWVAMLNREGGDMLLMAGDLVDRSLRPLLHEEMADGLRKLQMPVYACLGNHEYYSGEPGAQQFYRDAGIHLLRDDVVTIGDLCIIGRDDRTNYHRKSLGKIVNENKSLISNSSYTILLDHQPYHLEQAEQQHIDFQFSGHTHHGQIWPISWITESIYECAFGSHQRGNTRYYISSGLGIWGGKFRIGTRSEYIVAEVRSKK